MWLIYITREYYTIMDEWTIAKWSNSSHMLKEERMFHKGKGMSLYDLCKHAVDFPAVMVKNH